MKMVAARAGLSEPGIGDGPVAKFFRARFAEKSRSAEPVSEQPWIEIRPSKSPSHNRKLGRAALSCSSHTGQKNFATGPLRLAPSITAPRGTPRASVSSERLTPRLPRSVGLQPVFFPTQRRLAHRSVQRQPCPLNAVQRVIGQQPCAPERCEHARLDPFLKAPMC